MIKDWLNIMTWPYNELPASEFNYEGFNKIDIWGYIDEQEYSGKEYYFKIPDKDVIPYPDEALEYERFMSENCGFEDSPDELLNYLSIDSRPIYWSKLSELLRNTVFKKKIQQRKEYHKKLEDKCVTLVQCMYAMDELESLQLLFR